jgi:hypothetical protein
MDKPILKDEVKNTESFLKILKKKCPNDAPKIKIIGCSCLTYDCKNCGIGHL